MVFFLFVYIFSDEMWIVDMDVGNVKYDRRLDFLIKFYLKTFSWEILMRLFFKNCNQKKNSWYAIRFGS